MEKKKTEKTSPLVPVEEQPYHLPENWKWIRCWSISELFNGDRGTNYPSKKDYVQQGVPFINAGTIKDGGIDYSLANYISDDKFQSLRAGKIQKDDILYCLRGSLGKTAIIRDEVSGAISSSLCILRTKPNINREFFFWLLQSDCILMQQHNVDNGTAQPNLSAASVLNYSIPFPPLAEQQRIVDRIESLFAKLDEAKEKAQEALESFGTRKEALLQKAFGGELTAEWRTQNAYSMLDWTDEVLGKVCVINPPKINTKDFSDDLEVSFFPMPALSEIAGEITEPQTRKLTEVRQGFTNFSEGDVVFAKITPCMENGKCAVIGKLVNNIGFGTTEFFVLRCGTKLFNRYLFHMLRSITFRNEAKAVMAGAVGQQRVPKSFLTEYPLHLPPLDEQREIVRLLDDFISQEAEAKAKVEATLDAIEVMKKSILAKAFRGELGTNDPEDESAEELLKRTFA